MDAGVPLSSEDLRVTNGLLRELVTAMEVEPSGDISSPRERVELALLIIAIVTLMFYSWLNPVAPDPAPAPTSAPIVTVHQPATHTKPALPGPAHPPGGEKRASGKPHAPGEEGHRPTDGPAR